MLSYWRLAVRSSTERVLIGCAFRMFPEEHFGQWCFLLLHSSSSYQSSWGLFISSLMDRLLVCSKPLPLVGVSCHIIKSSQQNFSSDVEWKIVMHIALKGWSGNLVGITKIIALSNTFLTEGDQQNQPSRKTPTDAPVLHIVSNSWATDMQIHSCNDKQWHKPVPFLRILTTPFYQKKCYSSSMHCTRQQHLPPCSMS